MYNHRSVCKRQGQREGRAGSGMVRERERAEGQCVWCRRRHHQVGGVCRRERKGSVAAAAGSKAGWGGKAGRGRHLTPPHTVF